MHDKEILYFTEAFQLTQLKCYVDAIHKFHNLVDEFPESDLADDAMYNIGLSYYEMNQFQKSIEVLEEMIEKYPNGTISVLEGGNEFGKTAAKAYYLIIQCYIGLGNIQKAETYIPIIENYTDSYTINNLVNISFAKLANNAIETFKEFIKNTSN